MSPQSPVPPAAAVTEAPKQNTNNNSDTKQGRDGRPTYNNKDSRKFESELL